MFSCIVIKHDMEYFNWLGIGPKGVVNLVPMSYCDLLMIECVTIIYIHIHLLSLQKTSELDAL